MVLLLANAGLVGMPAGAADAPAADAAPWVLVNGRTLGGDALELRVEGGRIVDRGATVSREGARVADAAGGVVLPGFVDSHVHLAYLPAGAELARRGVAAAIDLAAPLDQVGRDEPLTVRWSGPMVTAEGGYPTTSWGSGGYGLPCRDVTTCTARVDEVVAAGATVVKVPLDPDPVLSDEALAAVVARAHERGCKVVAHALSDAGAARAAALGVDALAHVPVEALSEATVAAYAGRVVIGTLGAFGGAAEANAARLHAAGARLLYGTDFGNTRVRGIDGDELVRMARAGMKPADVVRAATSEPATFWGLDGLGSLDVGARAVFVVVPEALDAPEALRQLSAPSQVLRP